MPGPIQKALEAAGTKPGNDADTGDKVAYATAFSSAICKALRDALVARHPRVFPGLSAVEEKVKSGGKGTQKVDVLMATKKEGLLLNLSVKTQNFVDMQKDVERRYKKFTHNITRIIDQELLGEARACHDRYPHAVVMGLVVFPESASADASPKALNPKKRTDSDCSSVAEFAQRLRTHAGRLEENVRDPMYDAKLEAAFVALYRDDGEIQFLDVTEPIPRTGFSGSTLTMEQFVDRVTERYQRRSIRAREWHGEP